jgi:pyruvate formate lyase activating enzyme
MKITGIEKSSVIDWAPHISAVIFLEGCNFRCPCCHNKTLVLPELYAKEHIGESEVLDWLKTRIGKLDSVTVSGGEPTIHGPDLSAFMFQVKTLGYPIKLDTNGSNPQMIDFLISSKLIDAISMDIKAAKEDYDTVCGAVVNQEDIDRSISAIISSGIEHEFRTTVHPRFHDKEKMLLIANRLKRAKRYVLQHYNKNDVVDPTLNDCELYDDGWFNDVKSSIENLKIIDEIAIR